MSSVANATSPDPRDDVLVEIAQKVGVGCFRGSPDDKLLRYRDAALSAGGWRIVRVWEHEPVMLAADRVEYELAAAGPPRHTPSA